MKNETIGDESPAVRELISAAEEMAKQYCANRCGWQDHTSTCARVREAIIKIQHIASPVCCHRCGNPIDPDVCWCGDPKTAGHEGHTFVPMGCDCLRPGNKPLVKINLGPI